MTTPTRDEAVRRLEIILIPLRDADVRNVTSIAREIIEAFPVLASAPAPASGGVDAVALEKALNAPVQGGASVYDYFDTAGLVPKDAEDLGVKLGIPGRWHWHSDIRSDEIRDTLKIVLGTAIQAYLASLSPAATPVPEAGGLSVEGYVARFIASGERSTIPLAEWEKPYQDSGLIEKARREGYIWIGRDVACSIEVTAHGRTAAKLYEAERTLAALAKPASSPAGGDVREAALEYFAALESQPEKDCWDTEDGKEAPDAEKFASDWAWQDHHAKILTARNKLRAALSQSTSAGRVGE